MVFSSKISYIDFSRRLEKRGAEVGIDPEISSFFISSIIGLATTVISSQLEKMMA